MLQNLPERKLHPSAALNFVDQGIIQRFIDGIGYDVDDNGCHIWRGHLASNGYARGRIHGLNVPVHRAAWIAKNGPMEFSLHACHKCDVRNCINPDHIFPGSRRDNMQDCALKKRLGCYTKPQSMPKGEKHGSAKLTIEQAVQIWSSCASEGDLSKKYGVDNSVVGRIKRGALWKEEISGIAKYAARNDITIAAAIRELKANPDGGT